MLEMLFGKKETEPKLNERQMESLGHIYKTIIHFVQNRYRCHEASVLRIVITKNNELVKDRCAELIGNYHINTILTMTDNRKADGGIAVILFTSSCPSDYIDMVASLANREDDVSNTNVMSAMAHFAHIIKPLMIGLNITKPKTFFYKMTEYAEKENMELDQDMKGYLLHMIEQADELDCDHD